MKKVWDKELENVDIVINTEVHAQYEDQQANYDDYSYVQQGHDYDSVPVTKPQEVTIISLPRTTLAVKPGNPAHNGRVCSTWGNFHYKNFDGNIFHFPGLCNYVFVSHCKSAYEDFNIQIRHTVIENTAVISHITLKLDGVVAELTSDSVVVNGNPVQVPFSQSGILIERVSSYLKISAKFGLVFMWNLLDNLLVELDKKYANQTCGLCGDFNGIPTYNEFLSNDIKLTEIQFGNMQKMDGPTEQCEDPTSSSVTNCSNELSSICQTVLTGEAFVTCNELVGVQDYINSCIQDLCRCDESMTDFCICNTFAEYSRQCAHAGGQPLNWRTKELCNKTCPYNMQYMECGSPCTDTCTNPERSALCEDHCMDGCVCPPGTVFDDINNSGCIPLSECHCTYKGETYSSGASFASQCTSCTCTGGQWSCVSLSCPGTCSIEGGSHISTFDEKRYSFFGDCSYILTKLCDSNAFTVLAELSKCGLTDTETCLKGVAISISGGQTIIVVKPSGSVFVNTMYTQLPISAGNVTIFRPSSFFIIVETNFGIQIVIQLVPLMQLIVNIHPSYKGQTCGLCGNFNNIQADDFKVTSGIVEGTAAAFANTWKTHADCPNVKNIFENPCTLSIENEKYAQHWCGLLTSTEGPFAECHTTVNPAVYHTNCLFDTCNCEKSEDCMCAVLSSYVRACAAKGVLLKGWRTNVCTITSCPKSLTYSYVVDSCQATCRSLSEPDVICNIKFSPVDGCTCGNGTYMDENGKCVPADKCPCYYKGSVLPSGEVVHDNGVICSCTHGKLDCVRVKPTPVCAAPMVYFDCTNVTAGTIGSECQKSCQTLDMGCYSTQCVSGCVCPKDLVSDGKGGCVAVEDCPCVHNEASYNPGETIKFDCNTCTCKNRMWHCTQEPCLETCSVYGDGHYITFDGKRFSFSGDCEYTLAQDFCGKNSTNIGTFRIITENIPCGTTGTTCSKAIKIFVGNYELVLSDGKFEVIEKVHEGQVPYKIRYMGIYLVIDFENGLIVLWDKKTSIFIKLSPDFKGQVCGLCGNYDGNGINDFATRSQSVVEDVLEFGNSWKVSPTCPDAMRNKDPCSANPYRNSWAQKQCSIINSKVFATCHSQVEPNEYYEACVADACACDTGGDCECFCTAVAAYAQACIEAGICVAWRTPSICPLFCDYYNPQGECEWHYKPCGSPCMKTCRNPSGKCLHELRGLEGCYPKCPENKPYFNEDDMECVPYCGCYDDTGKYYKLGTSIPSQENCQSCECTMHGIKCKYDEDECYCTYDGKKYKHNEVIYNTTDGIGGCITATCSSNGTIDRKIYNCFTTITTTFTFSTSTPIPTTTVMPTISVCVYEVCQWSQWYDVSYPQPGIEYGDFETFDNLRAKGYTFCKAPKDIKCRAEKFPNASLNELEQKVECSTTTGLTCYNKDQLPPICLNFQIKILCCKFVPCEPITPTTKPAETTTPLTKTTTLKTLTTLYSTTAAQSTTIASKTTTLPTSTMISKTASTTPVIETTTVPTSTLRTTASSTLSTETAAISSTETVNTTKAITPTTPCKPKCKWSEWYDVHLPSLDNEGDSETYDDIKKAGIVICNKPENIECRAEKYPEKSIDDIGQIVQCNVSNGLVCRNADQQGVLPVCYNYQIKVLCCDDFSNCSLASTTTETPTTATTDVVSTETSTLISTSTETTTSSTVGTSTTTPTETTMTQVKTTPLTTTETTTVTTTPSSATTKQTTTITGTTEIPVTVTTPYTTTISSTAVSATTTPTTTETTSATHITPLATTKPTSSITVTTTPEITTTPEMTTSITMSPTSTTVCTKEVCEWSQWYDLSYPGSAINDGDFETFKDIRAKGYKVCKAPKAVECRAQNYPDTPISELEQNIICNKKEGLICYNKNQLPPKCYNYEIKIECCTNVIVPCSTTTTITTIVKTTPPISRTVTTTSYTTTTTLTTPTKTTLTTVPLTTISENTSAPTEMTVTTTPATTMTLITTTTSTTKNIITQIRTTTNPQTQSQDKHSTTQMKTTTKETTISTKTHETIPVKTTASIYTTPSTTTTVPTTVTKTSTRVTTSPQTTVTIPPETTTSKITPITETTGPTTRTNPVITTTLPPTERTTTSPISTTSPATTPISTPTTQVTVSTSTTGTTSTVISTTQSLSTTPATSTSTTVCQPTCTWSKWFDVDFPSSGPKEGDIETYNNIRAAGEIICAKPENIQCRAESYPDTSIDHIGQVVHCDVNYGLICKNEEQVGKFQMCLNYQIRVLCCQENPDCENTATTPPTTTVTKATTRVTTSPQTTVTIPPETTTSKTTPITETTGPTTRTSPVITTTLPPTERTTTSPISTTSPATTPISTPTTQITVSTSTTGTTSTVIATTQSLSTTPATSTSTTVCQPTCTWSKWFDVDFPSSGPKEGDIETYNNIRAAGEIICAKPENIQCRAESYPDTSIDHIGQVVHCDVNYGLICKNEEQVGKFQMCLNYQIRVLCCQENPDCENTATTPPTTTVTKATTRVTTSPQTTVTIPPETTTSKTTPITETTGPTTRTSPVITTTLPPTERTTTSPISTTSPATTPISTPTTQITVSTSTTGTTSTVISTTQSLSTTPATSTSTTVCQPTCTWSKWFDVDFPSSGPKEGDIETYNNIRAAGEIICAKPENIQCRAESYPDTSIDHIGQVVHCDVNYGLICKNEEQVGKFQMCLNYQIRALCCQENPNCEYTPTTPPTTTVTKATTRVTTSPQTTVTIPPETTTSKITPITETTGPTTRTNPVITTTLPPTERTTTSPISTTSPATTPISTPTTQVTVSTSTTGTTSTVISTTQSLSTTPATSTSTTVCQPTCTWSKWFDVDFPSSGPKEGDIETYNNIRAAGEIICAKPENIQCRAESYPDTSIDHIGQVVHCDVNYGLICKNEEQVGKFQMCLNYQIRVLCCQENPDCENTATTPPTTTVTKATTRVTTSPQTTVTIPPETTTSKTTPITETTGPTTRTSPVITTTLPPTERTTTSPISTTSPATTPISTPTTQITVSTSTTGTTSTVIATTQSLSTTPATSTSTTVCQPTCTWSKWFDVDFPSSGPKEGDIETYNNIRAAGEIICAKPENIQCRAESYPDTSIDHIGQVVHCDVNYGLMCKNEEQVGKFQMCLNYQIRVLCCQENPDCENTATTPPTTTVTKATTRVTTSPQTTVTIPPETTTSKTTPITETTGPTTRTSPVITTTLPPTERTTTSPISTTSPATTPISTPTTQITVSTSTTGTTSTVISTTQSLSTTPATSTSTTVCQPTCTWSKWFDVDFPSSGPKEGDIETYNNIRAAGEIICAKPENIQCRAESYPDTSIDHIGQVVHCDVNYGLICKNEEQVGKFQMCLNYQIRALCCQENPNCEYTATTPPTTTLTKATTRVTTSPQTTVTIPPETTTSKTTPITETTGPTTRTSPVITTTLPPTERTTTSPISTTSPATTPISTPTTQITVSTSTTGTTSTVISTTQSLSTTPATSTSTTVCQPTCTWSKWFDADFPSSGPKEGDIETYNNIRAAGETICAKPENIQCRAESYPDTSIDHIGQVVHCDFNYGLMCKNEEQVGKFQMCLNYQIRVLCCQENPDCENTATTPPTTTVTKATTRVTTSPQTTVTIPPETTTSKTTPITETTGPTTRTSPVITTTLPPTERTTTSPISTTSPATTPISTPTTQITVSTSTTGTTSTVISTTQSLSTTPATSTSTTVCQPTCTWSKWFDVDFPSSGPKEGDIETYNNIRAAGEIICAKPENIQCRAESYPDTSIDHIGQVVHCDVNYGLMCKNEEQVGKFQMCLNYQIRVLCCQENPDCENTATTPPTTTVTKATTRVTTSPQTTVTIPPETTTSKTTPITETTGPTTRTSPVITTTLPPTERTTTSPTSTTSPATTPISTPTTQITVSTSTTGTTSTVISTTQSLSTTPATSTSTTVCQPTCTWSKWFDVDFPSSGPKEGDIETYNNIRAAGEIICAKPENIQCRAESYPDTSIDHIGQVVHCDVNYGLICKNEEQVGKFQMCLNYQIRALCCQENPNCEYTPTTPPTTTLTKATTRVTTSPQTTVTIPPETTTSKTTPITETTGPTTRTSPVITTTLPPTERTTTSPISTTSPATTPISTPTTQITVSTSTTGTTSTVISTTQSLSTTPATSTSTTVCQPTCTWSKWFDADFPSSGPKEGDIETYNNIRAAGETICAKPENIQCRAESYPDTSIDHIGQVVHCDVNYGLMCKNEEQVGKFQMCLNYQIRVLCCQENPDCENTATTPPTTTVTKATTRVTTSPQTTVTIPPETTTSKMTPITETTGPTTRTSPVITTTLPPTERTTTSPISTTSPATTPISTPTTQITVSTSTTGTTSTVISTTQSLSTTPATSTSTTVCQPTCTWSKWFDVDFPSSGPKEGDIETYNNIRAAGEIICAKPENIQCRAESYPDTSIDHIGQVVHCDVNYGLMCKNEEQVGKFQMCLNYQIRVLCCQENPDCEITATTPPTTTVTKATTRVTTSPQTTVTIPPETTTSKTTPVTETTGPTTRTSPVITTTLSPTEITTTVFTTSAATTPCFCRIDDHIFAAGDVIYSKIDKDGCEYTAVCSKLCAVERFKGPCKSTTPATTAITATSTSISTTTPTMTVSSTTVIECPSAKPPRKTGETWALSNCTTATCEGNNKVVIQPVKCPPVEKTTCANGYPPVKVFREDGCCYHYECECVCSGWGDPHYITFDGQYYTFLGNCTYVLVKQIIPKYNFRVDIDNYLCSAEDGVSCPQAIIIYYNNIKVVMTRELYKGAMVNKIIFNNSVVKPGFVKDGISVSTLGINMIVEIRELGATILFSGLIFSVKLPFSKFGNNTEGQCGTCTNTRSDDCRLPSGKIISSCTQMAPHWKIDDDKKYCTGTSTPTPNLTTPSPSCAPPALCKIILSKVFEECHKVIPPQDFYKGCVFDACYINNASMQCSSLEIYASLCAAKGLCIDWRGETKGKCPYKCPAGKVFKPCGPLNPATCDSRAVQHNGTGLTEGCFCPEEKILVNKNSGICVPSCDFCPGPEGLPKFPGEQWKSNCQDCSCDNYTLTVQCNKHPCQPTPPVSCDNPGFVPVQSLKPEDPCCVQTECRCNTSYCPKSVYSCPPGFELIPEVQNGNCCTIFKCKLVPGCMTNGTFYMPGAVIPSGTCEKCICSAKVEPESQRNIVDCQPIPCDTKCPMGYVYKRKEGVCCGECVQEACIVKTEKDIVHVLPVGEVWHEPGDNCTFYKCEEIEDQFVPVTLRKVCPLLNPEDCNPADIRVTEDGCCKICRSKLINCGLHTTTTVIRHGKCQSSAPVELTYCNGNCNTSSMYSLEANVMQHRCKCCQEVKTSKRQVNLSCPDGKTINYAYIHVEQCKCVGTECSPQTLLTTPAEQKEQEQQQEEDGEQ
ncbi:mucin-5AC [Carettochelys insculpta]|uniref:mucin-5AC n=1 Tax=Carettochelys insculpta TaxID=44489 RepID=UPI003EBAABA2